MFDFDRIHISTDMPGKMVKCRICSKVMRSDNLKNHIKNVHRNDLIVPKDDSLIKVASTDPLSKMEVLNSILSSSSSPENMVDKDLSVDPVLMKGPGVKNKESSPKKAKQSSTCDNEDDPKIKDIGNTSSNNDDDEEAEILKVLENLDELHQSNVKKLIKNYLISDVKNDELLLPKLLDIVKDLTDLERLIKFVLMV